MLPFHESWKKTSLARKKTCKKTTPTLEAWDSHNWRGSTRKLCYRNYLVLSTKAPNYLAQHHLFQDFKRLWRANQAKAVGLPFGPAAHVSLLPSEHRASRFRVSSPGQCRQRALPRWPFKGYTFFFSISGDEISGSFCEKINPRKLNQPTLFKPLKNLGVVSPKPEGPLPPYFFPSFFLFYHQPTCGAPSNKNADLQPWLLTNEPPAANPSKPPIAEPDGSVWIWHKKKRKWKMNGYEV